MKVLVTGGSGFLGRHLVPRLRARGHEVLAPRSAELDLTDRGQTRSWIGAHRPQAIVHGAALYGGIAFTVREPATLLFHNSLMAIQLFEAAVGSGVERVISIGSACAYPGATSGDMREEALWDGPLHPSVEAYGFSKRVQLVAQRACREQFGLEGVHLAVTNLYGPHDAFDPDRSHVVGAMVRRFVQAAREEARQVTCWGDGSPVREFLYVTDAADAIVAVLELDGLISPLNIGTGVGTSIRELAERVADAAGFAGEIRWDASRPNGVPRKVLDVRRMREELGFEPQVSLQEGLADTVDWFREHGA